MGKLDGKVAFITGARRGPTSLELTFAPILPRATIHWVPRRIFKRPL